MSPTPERLAKIEGYRNHRLPFVIAVINMSKEMNIGSLLRTSHATGVQELLLVGEASFNTYAAATADKWTDVSYLQSTEELIAHAKEQEMEIVAIEKSDTSVSLFEAEYPKRPLFVLGAEKFGVPQDVLDAAVLTVEIPQWGLVPSLNVAAAGSVVIYDYLAKVCGARKAAKTPETLETLRNLALKST